MLATADSERTVLYVGTHPTLDFVNTSTALRQTGEYTTVLVVHWSTIIPSIAGSFDAVLVWNDHMDLARMIVSLEPWIIHTQGASEIYPYPLFCGLLTDSPITTNIMLMPSIYRSNESASEMHEASSEAEHDTAVENYVMNELSAATAFNYSSKALIPRIRAHNSPIHVTDFHNYILSPGQQRQQIPDHHNRYSIVHAGIVQPSSRAKHVAGDMQFLELARTLAVQDIALHLYPSPHTARRKQRSQLQEYIDYSKQEPYFTYHDPVLPNELASELGEFGFGSVLFGSTGLAETPITRHWIAADGIPSKFFNYLDAGLPVLSNEFAPELEKLLNKFGIGIVVPDHDKPHLRKILGDLDYQQLRSNVLEAQQHFSMENNLSRIIALYELVVNSSTT